jgi:hypothetical protein
MRLVWLLSLYAQGGEEPDPETAADGMAATAAQPAALDAAGTAANTPAAAGRKAKKGKGGRKSGNMKTLD